jgi:26S proteasome regulatory subunit N13
MEALFAHSPEMNLSGRLLEFKAGRMFRDGETNLVRPDDAKGLIYLERSERVIFGDDAEFFKVTQSPGRVYALRFRSSNEILFFWMQHRHPERDEMLCRRINEYILDTGATMMDDQSPLMRMIDSSIDYDANEEALAVAQQRQPVPGAAAATAASTGSLFQSDQTSVDSRLNSLRELLSNIHVPETDVATDHAYDLNDVLTPEHLKPILDDATLRQTIFPHLPKGTPHTLDGIEEVIASPQFQQSIRALSIALNSGQVAPLVQELGLPASAGTSVKAFLEAIHRMAQDRAEEEEDSQMLQADPAPENSGDRMEED